ncbi:translation elongation factor Ts [Geobacter sulfurreducens]|uniref:Elongation factor Ts n=1 Tax=Geobacter sulfurreducens (strain ATCC 51573 / DSM 12127 / PCA) TaxID=243231 RepID=EFTS_GEOSL|nr:translation elongation factor Ts [Geobacter sulfurreducens]P61333.1 RecName: Full=Elongation factor Ts; Short=EF-Ts [Geobacter sulfurreducens PCA]AAR35296.1 translation elongation factor Ts [Geobacter sulfurreducens PCA]ADI84758.1 translation elongation factor Ts [Geobacter sulfurreducens KN400]AJY68167.1 elongation factor Ts [Geobacter sulfurreducens]QVW33873.1 translation elongation factor Ts [Geobacter sulfurreducens]UAC02660.1 translation elongation factor Ts [Geobacter sulfurreducens]
MSITAAQVNELRKITGAGLMDCKKALTETNGDLEQAVDYLRKKGLAAASKKAGRAATEGAVGSYIHAGGKIGVLVEVNCETDFVARNDNFQAFVKDIAMHIAAASPQYVRREEVPAELLEREKEIYRAKARETGKPENIIEKIIEGQINKFYAEICLMEQNFVKDPDKTVQQFLNETISSIGENMSVRRFARFVLGEGLEKKESDFAAEVAAAAGL